MFRPTCTLKSSVLLVLLHSSAFFRRTSLFHAFLIGRLKLQIVESHKVTLCHLLNSQILLC